MMTVEVCTSRTTGKGRAIAFGVLSLLGFVSSALSEPVSWFPDQFVVTVNPNRARSASVRIEADTGEEGLVARSLSRSKLLVHRRSAKNRAIGTTASLHDGPVPFKDDGGFCKALIRSGEYSACSPNYVLHATATTPNDPSFGSLYGMSTSQGIDAPRAWDLTKGSKDVVIAVIDTGVDADHPDLRENLWTNDREIPGNGIDDDNNGYADDIHGMNAIARNGSPDDDNSHGTHVSGTIGAQGNNGIGVAGVNWNVRIMALKFLNSGGSGSLSDAIVAMEYMILMKQRGVNIRAVNNSWGGGDYSEVLAEEIQKVIDAGIVFVAAAGNETNDNDASASYPAGYPNVLAVAAIDRSGNLASFSNYGARTVHIAAPGVGILSTVPGGGYTSLSGTSMATPHVTGALGLLFANEPTLAPAVAVQRVLESGSPLSTLEGVVSTGRALNVGRLLYGETLPLPAAPPPEEPCSYLANHISYDPELAVTATEIRQNVDEGDFLTVPLPFSMPLYRSQLSSVVVSPNGVLYAKGPGTLDFQNTGRATANAIAALHSDLIAEGDGSGMR